MKWEKLFYLGPEPQGLFGTFRLLEKESIQNELELIDEQLEEIEELVEEYNERTAAVTCERLRRFPDNMLLGDRAAFQRMIEWRKEEVNKFGPSSKRRLILILLPHQNRRLSQIVCRGMGLKILLMQEVEGHLEFTDDQKKQIESIFSGFYRAGPGQPGLPLPADEKEENDNECSGNVWPF